MVSQSVGFIVKSAERLMPITPHLGLKKQTLDMNATVILMLPCAMIPGFRGSELRQPCHSTSISRVVICDRRDVSSERKRQSRNPDNALRTRIPGRCLGAMQEVPSDGGEISGAFSAVLIISNERSLGSCGNLMVGNHLMEVLLQYTKQSTSFRLRLPTSI